MNIEGFGDNITEDFYNMGYLKRIYDYYTLDKYKEELMELEGFGEKSIIKLLSSIEKSKENSLERLLFALGIRHVGAKTAKILARNFKNIDALMKASYEELSEINDIGDIIAKSIVEYFQNEENLELIQAYYNWYQKGYRIDLRKIKGHNGHLGNELADKLATGEVKTFEEAEIFWKTYNK